MQETNRKRVCTQGSLIYGMAFLGALIYYMQQATGFQEGVAGIFKALIWPAILVYRLMSFLKL